MSTPSEKLAQSLEILGKLQNSNRAAVADEHFRPVGAAPQQEQIAGPKAWDQIRSRKPSSPSTARTRPKNNLTPCGCPRMSADEARKQSTQEAFLGGVAVFLAVGVSNARLHIGEFAGFPQGFRHAKVASFFPLRLGSSVSVQRSGSFACSGERSALFPVSCAKAILRQSRTELQSDTA